MMSQSEKQLKTQQKVINMLDLIKSFKETGVNKTYLESILLINFGYAKRYSREIIDALIETKHIRIDEKEQIVATILMGDEKR